MASLSLSFLFSLSLSLLLTLPNSHRASPSWIYGLGTDMYPSKIYIRVFPQGYVNASDCFVSGCQEDVSITRPVDVLYGNCSANGLFLSLSPSLSSINWLLYLPIFFSHFLSLAQSTFFLVVYIQQALVPLLHWISTLPPSTLALSHAQSPPNSVSKHSIKHSTILSSKLTPV
jgi:hypothetical protein